MTSVGARFASLRVQKPRLPLWGKAAVACFFGLSTSGCLVTDQIDLPTPPRTPPILTSTTPMSGGLIRFNTAMQELKLSIQVRDEDTTEVLRPRWRIITGNNPPRTPTSPKDLDYDCPEQEIMGTGKVDRGEFTINLPGSRFVRGLCYRIDVAVSATFKSCTRYPELFDITTNEDNEEDVGRATFWVWPLAGGTVDSDAAAKALLESCNYTDYQPAATTTSGAEK